MSKKDMPINYKEQLYTNIESKKKEPGENYILNRLKGYLCSVKPKVVEFFGVLKKIANSSVVIFIKGYPDPDSIVSSLAFQYIASFYGGRSTIVHFDKVSRRENQMLVEKLGVGMVEYTEGFDFSLYEYAVFNDTQSSDLPVSLPESLKPVVLVDHHKDLHVEGVTFVDVREDAGSTAAIYVEYLMHGDVSFDREDSQVVLLATGLMHAIRTDTDDFALATEIDFIAAAYLNCFVDKEMLRAISSQDISAESMDITHAALDNKVIRGRYLFSGVGFVRQEDRDSIAQAADYILQREGIEIVIVYGVVGGEYVDGSLRTKSLSLDCDKLIKDLFGAHINGKPYGGGRRGKGGFQIPLGNFVRCDDNKLWDIVRSTIEGIFSEKLL